VKPEYNELLKGHTTWTERYNDVIINLSFHGYIPPSERYGISDYGRGTWCYYLILDERMFSKEDWKKLCFKPKKTEYGLNYDYHRFPDVDFHCGITFYEVKKQYDHGTDKDYKIVKAGCDYNHLCDQEQGYSDTYESVLYDAKHSVDKLLEKFTNVKMRCKYSGKWDEHDMFYKAKNGFMVHKSYQEKLKQDNWDAWLPAT